MNARTSGLFSKRNRLKFQTLHSPFCLLIRQNAQNLTALLSTLESITLYETIRCTSIMVHFRPGGGGLQLISGKGAVRPGFPNCGACELTFASERGGLVSWKFPNLGARELKISKYGGLWAENFQIWGLFELKISKFGDLWAKIWVKIEAVEAKISKFGLVNWLFCLKWDPCELQERREKGVFRAAHPYTPFLGQCPPPPGF